MKLTKENIEEAIRNTDSMAAAAAHIGVHKNTFRKYAERYGVYSPTSKKDSAQRGGLVSGGWNKIPLNEILDGLWPSYSTSHLSKRLRKDSILEYVCQSCGNIGEWENKPLTLELDHVNGDRTDHKIENLRFLCPNCHTQTPTYKSKNIKQRKVV